jgi:diguanylate cyclase (GGDEF)-like protein
LSIRRKTYLPWGLALVALAVAIFVASQFVFGRGFSEAETARMQADAQRAQTALMESAAGLGSAVSGYAASDATVQFLKDKNDNYRMQQLTDGFFVRAHANLAIFVRNDGTVVWSGAFDLTEKRAVEVPKGLNEFLEASGPLVKHATAEDAVSGVIVVGQAPMLVSSQPVVAGDGKGAVQGAIIVGRWLDEGLLAALSSQTGLALSVQRSAAGSLASGAAGTAVAAGSSGVAVSRLDSGGTAASVQLDDVFGEPAVVLNLENPAAVATDQGDSFRYFMMALAGIVLLFAAVTIVILETAVFRRLGRVAGHVRRARLGGGRFVPLSLKANDEIGLLAQTLDAGLSQIDSTRSQQEKQAKTLAEALEELKGRHRELESAHKHLQQLQEASSSLSGTLDIHDALAQLENVALDIFEADELWILRLQEGQQLEGLTAFSRNTPGHVRLPGLFGCDAADVWLPQQSNSLLRTVFQTGQPVFIESVPALDAKDQQRFFGVARPDLGGLHSLGVVPLFADRVPVGVAISASVKASAFGDDRRSTIHLLAGQIAQALKNATLYEEIKYLGEIDSLSGLHNRRRSLEQLEGEVARAARYQGTFSILIADIDNFKLFNDTYGHPVGDEIIKRVAGLLSEESRASDFVGRFGGDEFILILPETYRAAAGAVADRLRAALASASYIAPDGSAIPLRMSFGAASYPQDGAEGAVLIAMADANLYESKRWGGDTVTTQRKPVGDDSVDSGGFSTLDALVSAVDNKDHYTRRHSAQVAEHSAALAQALGFPKEQLETLRVAAMLHDVGKIALPDAILRKPGSLTRDEVEAVKQHPLVGGMMLAQHLPGLEEVRHAVSTHHERWDGKGYPSGLDGRDIPLLGRVLAVADSYSAMTTDRPYRAAMKMEDAISELEKGAGSQFDPDLVPVFVECLSRGLTASPTKGRL